jgi:S-(hydroxymethyl)glutathione dehydrogenase/alcohol dehydrogenase
LAALNPEDARMKAAVLREVRTPLLIEDVQISKPGPHEVLVRTVAAGVCHSDLHFVEGSYKHPLPAVLGHESAGVVEQVGSEVRSVKVGDHVITCLSAFCGHCDFCLGGEMSLCISSDTRRDKKAEPRLSQPAGNMFQYLNLSSFAEQMLIHEHALVSIRKDMPLDRACLIGCGVTTGIGAVTRTARVQPGETVAIIGCGGVGLAAVNGAVIASAGRIIAIDRFPAKLELAKTFGATDVINASDGDPVAQVMELTGSLRGVHHAFEAIGLKATVEQAFRMIRRGGTATVIGMVPVGVNVEVAGSELLNGKKLQGSQMGSNRFPIDMPRFVDFYLSGKLNLDDLISRRIKLDQVNEALDELKTGELARSVIMFDA